VEFGAGRQPGVPVFELNRQRGCTIKTPSLVGFSGARCVDLQGPLQSVLADFYCREFRGQPPMPNSWSSNSRDGPPSLPHLSSTLKSGPAEGWPWQNATRSPRTVASVSRNGWNGWPELRRTAGGHDVGIAPAPVLALSPCLTDASVQPHSPGGWQRNKETKVERREALLCSVLSGSSTLPAHLQTGNL
jgi:hypothetical protein